LIISNIFKFKRFISNNELIDLGLPLQT